MIDKHSFTIEISEAGKIPQTANERFRDVFRAYSGKKISVQIEKFKKKRSGEQNAYYWSVCIPLIVEKTGFSPEEIHEYLITKFIDKTDIVVGGESIKVNKRTHNLTTVEFMEYISEIQRFASEKLDLFIPDPIEGGGGL